MQNTYIGLYYLFIASSVLISEYNFNFHKRLELVFHNFSLIQFCVPQGSVLGPL